MVSMGTKSNSDLRCVIVEEQQLMRKSIRKALEGIGEMQIEDFSNLRDAHLYIKNHPVDLIVSEVNFAKGNGYDLLRSIRSRAMANDIPFVFVSGDSTRSEVVHAVDMGITEYVIKPVDVDDFRKKIQGILENYKNPGEKMLLLREAESKFISKDFDGAAELFEIALTLDQKSSRVLVGLAQVHMQKQDYTEAERLLKISIEINALYFPAFASLADLYLILENYSEAKMVMQKELSINGKQPFRRLKLADLLIKAGDVAAAVAEIRQALLDSPKSESLLLKMGEVQALSGNHERAVHYYLKTRRYHPHSTAAIDGMVQVYCSIEQEQKALHTLKDLSKAHPRQADLYIARAKLQRQMGSLEKCLEELDAGLKEIPESLVILSEKVTQLAKLGKLDEAILTCRHIVTLSPTGENYGRLGLMTLRRCSFSQASAAYEKAQSLEPENLRFIFNLACVYENQKLWEKALQQYEKVIVKAPEVSEATEAGKRIRRIRFRINNPEPSASAAPRKQAKVG